jgi:hypothetical protein
MEFSCVWTDFDLISEVVTTFLNYNNRLAFVM